MQVTNAALSALVNLLLLAGLPFSGYWLFQKYRRKRDFTEITRRIGLRWGRGVYIGYSALFASGVVAALVIWPPDVEPLTREGAAQREFVGLGLSSTSIIMALLYGVIKTGFPEELLFRGMIAGSLSRRMSVASANFLQALIFVAPHLLLLAVMPEAVVVLPLIFVGSLFAGWVRIHSGSIIGPWLIHATLNVATCMSVAIRS